MGSLPNRLRFLNDPLSKVKYWASFGLCTSMEINTLLSARECSDINHAENTCSMTFFVQVPELHGHETCSQLMDWDSNESTAVKMF